MKFIYILIFTVYSFTPFAQTNSSYLYTIEKEGDNMLASRRFEDAIKIYSKYKIITDGKVIEPLEKKIDNTRILINVYSEGYQAYRAGKYIQSIDKFKQYRKLFPGISIQEIDLKIENSLVQLEKQNNFKKLDEKDKIIFGFERNYIAEKALEEGKFSKAKSLYESAIKSVRNVREKNSVMELASKRIAQINKCNIILDQMSNGLLISKQIEILDSYRSNGGVIVKPMEEKIAYLRLQNEGIVLPSQNSSFEVEIQQIAQTCNIAILLAYVGNSESSLFKKIDKDTLYKTLNDLNINLSELKNIKIYGDESQRDRFVFGGYETLIVKSDKIPLVGESIKTCLKTQYFDILYSEATRIYDQELNLNVARDMAINAKQFAVDMEQMSRITELLAQINNRIGCETIIKSLNLSLNTINTNIDNCLLSLSKTNFQRVIKATEGCMTPTLETRLSIIRDRISDLEAKIERIETLKTKINNHLLALHCEDVGSSLDELRAIDMCDKAQLLIYVNQKSVEIEECKRKNKFNENISKVTRLLASADGSNESIHNLENKLSNAEYAFQAAEKIANLTEQTTIKELRKKIDYTRQTIQTFKIQKRRDRLKNYNRIVKPELYAATMFLNPKINFNNQSVNTNATSSGNYEAGINLRFFKRSTILSSTLGLRYATNDFQISNISNSLSEQVKAEYIGSEYKITTGSEKNSHLYLGLGLGFKVPIRVVYQDFISNRIVETSYFQENSYVKPHVYSSLALGYESHRKNLGYSLELFVRFSGTLTDDETKKSIFPILKYDSFNFSQYGQTYYNTSSVSWGIALTTHLW